MILTPKWEGSYKLSSFSVGVSGPMCWICGGKGCKCCDYLVAKEQPKCDLSSEISEIYNPEFLFPVTTYLTKLWFMEKGCFGNVTTVRKKVERRSRVGVPISDLWNQAKRRAVSRSLIQMQKLGKEYQLPEPVVRVLRFRKLLDLLGTSPISPIKFEENEQILRILTASHLRLIVGKKEWKDHMTQLYPLIENERDLSTTENLIWLTNRQQGKTTNLAKFNAALIMLSPVGGNLKYVYSTGLDRSVEMCRDSKRQIRWIQSDIEAQEKVQALGMTIPYIKTDNERMFVTECCIKAGVYNTLKARPMNRDGCRGDNPHSADFDEIGFMDASFFLLFALPLLQVGGRIFTMATTPPPINSFFDDYARKIKKRNEEGDYFFMFINHSMACVKCIEKDVAHKCSHKLYLVPPWKVVSKFVAMRRTVPSKQQKAFEAEIFGIMGQENPTYFPKKLTDYVFLEKAKMRMPKLGENPVVYFGVDPASHDVSYMGLSAISYTTDGQIVILGMSEVSINKCDLGPINMCVTQFASKVLEHAVFRKYPRQKILVVPVVECNHSEPVAREIVNSIRCAAKSQMCTYYMPFKKRYFPTAISEDVGVWSTEDMKSGWVRMLYFIMFENRLHVADPLVTMGDIHKKEPKLPTASDICELIRDELVQFHDDGKTITGKTANTNDDMAMALLMGIGASQMIRATAILDNMTLMAR